MTERCVLGIDTSNYKTSLAVIRGDRTEADLRRFLKVREGQRGLRQSEALFQHVQNLPEMFQTLRERFSGSISAVAYSTRPRPVKGSYMPCFTAGAGQAVSIAASLDVPVIGFSHQEGHIEASLASCGQRPAGAFLGCHFSGGTCEVLRIIPKEPKARPAGGFEKLNGENAFFGIAVTGGTKDISYGQVLDRAGVAMGFPFPCGQALDEIASGARESADALTRIRVEDAAVHLSGFDAQIRRTIDADSGTRDFRTALIREIFEKISDSITEMLIQSAGQTGIGSVFMSGGVSSSRFIRERITGTLQRQGISVYFADAELSSDNAVGTALLGKRYLWD